ncbi:hypothetical protein RJ639_037256 [Escallonia herrerae]|uniref:GrpE protein homolog n=1 Tax=Escallonia herrerae TaxID=1293975 RepID=A0AA89B9X3_9ASTE|nr:hypothetical protein RJ639_037256 [Escallonia herrerae]
MSVSRIVTRLSRGVLAQSRNSLLVCTRQNSQPPNISILSKQFHSLRDPQSKVVMGQVSLLHHSVLNTSAFQRIGFSSATSHQNNEESGKENTVENNDTAKPSSDTDTDQNGESNSDLEPQANTSRSVKRRRRAPKRTAFSDSDSEIDLSKEDLLKLVAEKENLLKTKQKEIERCMIKFCGLLPKWRMSRTGQDVTRSPQESLPYRVSQRAYLTLWIIWVGLLQLSKTILKIDTSKDDAGAVQLLKTLLDGVEMTEKQLAEAYTCHYRLYELRDCFKHKATLVRYQKFGVEKYDPTDEQFDPNTHNAVIQVPDPSKPPDTVAVVLKSGYLLHDRVIRPAEVGVTVAVDNKEADQGS